MNTSLRFGFIVATAVLFCFQKADAQNTSPYWSLAGNSNATSSSKLGTTNNIPIKLYTYNKERLRIDTFGRVLIGTTTATSRLSVNAATGISPFIAQVNGSTKLFVSSGGGVSVGSGTAAPANGLYVAGNMGIGTATPALGYKLHVAGKGLFSNGLIVQANSSIPLPSSGTEALTVVGVTYAIKGTYVCTECQLNDIPPAGVWGYGNGNFGAGVLAQGYVGLYATGNNTGIQTYGNYIGISATTGSQGADAGYFDGDVYTSGTYLPSASKLKKNIMEIPSALALLGKLQPREYEYKQDENYRLMNLPKGKRYGLIAEELEQVLPNLVKETTFDSRMAMLHDGKASSQSTTSTEKIEFKAVNYTELIPILIKGMQEQEQHIQEQDAENKALKAEVAELRSMIMELKKGTSGVVTFTSAYLRQNTPNPVNGTTSIGYYIPETSTSARLILTNAEGQVIKTINLATKGTNWVNLNTSMLAVGAYNYTLYVDERQVDTKRLVIVK